MDNNAIEIIRDSFVGLRHLNIGGNLITKIEKVYGLKDITYLKSLILAGNPISLLDHYYKTVTDNLSLIYFDNQKYIKE